MSLDGLVALPIGPGPPKIAQRFAYATGAEWAGLPR